MQSNSSDPLLPQEPSECFDLGRAGIFDSSDSDDTPSVPTPTILTPPSTLKLPKFWETSPVAWVTVAETLFATHRITSEQVKFHCVVNSLEPNHIEKVAHVLVSANLSHPYTALKQALLKRFEASDNFKLNKLLSLPSLDPNCSNPKRPTELLIEMKNLIGQSTPLGHVAENLLKKLFLDKLPAQVRIILAALPEIFGRISN